MLFEMHQCDIKICHNNMAVFAVCVCVCEREQNSYLSLAGPGGTLHTHTITLEHGTAQPVGY